MSMDLSEQYDKIYRYCYFKLMHKETAEDITQETFLRFFDGGRYEERGKTLQYLYTIARNLCIDEFRKRPAEQLSEIPNASYMQTDTDMEDRLLTSLSVKTALRTLDKESRELLLLRYVNEVPVSVICNIMGFSRFAVYRKTNRALRKIREQLGKEDFI